MGLTVAEVFGISVMLLTFAFNSINGWTLDADCTGTDAFCDGVYWTAVVEYLLT